MFEGVLTALVTPFRDGTVDERALQELVEIQIAAGVDGLVPCGSTGESATLSHGEHRRVIEVVVAAARGRVQVVAGTGSNSTLEAIELTRHAKEAGADGALLISPYYNKPTQEGIVQHYAAIAAETAFPLVVYNIPGRTASNILPATFARLAEIEQVVAVKDSCGDLDQVAHMIAATPDDFSVLSGDDWATLPMMTLGGAGVISTAANVAPSDVVELVRAHKSGDLERARETYYRLLPLFDVLFCETNPIPLKAALALRGLCSDELRLPLTPITSPNRERLQVAMKEFGLL
ncbi:MAG: 4-hydroxy-tetrahydrodipicolinate synthase [Deltaproteobacteria bacterium]|nr:4-hydroxy-tetrahydrodipicolinate synthase [Deltaproteobacteria bacterium]MBW2394487.1 4-hydroxy-tetrahydrodipicolinate synthase [Deltaproteobacteria bacterium]